ncbi:hypothetical protein [Alkalibacillus silvisoli]|uniref:Uncharacterized protein n=1 Tax=Alkalibacillus silvisoli TaxID=392823 RepID=A0ABN1AB34_9BACI
MLPSTHQYGYESTYNAIDLGVHEYLISGLDQNISIQKQLEHQAVPLAYPIAIMLDSAATQLVNASQVHPLHNSQFPDGGMFSYLSKNDRIRTLSALENLKLDLYLLPSPFQNNGGMVKFITDALNRFSMFGYYSEWPAYGTTRLNPPGYRTLEFFPPGWFLVGYPGVSLGYRDFRGFLLTMAEVNT